MTDQRSTDVEIHWRASLLTESLITCTGVALAAAVLSGRWQLIAFAAPLIGVLLSVHWQRPLPRVTVHASPGSSRCFESERVRFLVRAETDDGSAVPVRLSALAGMSLHDSAGATDVDGSEASAARWGRYPIRATVEVPACGGLLTGTATVDAAEVFVFPVAPAQSTGLPRTELLDRLGTHLTRHVGRGVEYANIRPYVAGDHLRTVNWPVSARRGSLHVTERLSERAADVVVLVDQYDQPAGPATEATERTVRGAVQVVQSALRSGDRAGVVSLGGQARWLGADIGRRQFYEVLDAVLGAGSAFEVTAGTLAPRAALPPRAVVVAFSTLLDTDFALALIDLCHRGHVVIAVDVLVGAPFETKQDPLVDRMWGLQRSFMYRDMRTVGVDVVPWGSEVSLEQAMHLVPDRRLGRSSRRQRVR